MTEESIQQRRERLKFRSWRRGFRELDLILGNWADQNIHKLEDSDLTAYEALLTAPDWDVYYWITQNKPPDFPHNTPLLDELMAFALEQKS